MSMTQAERLEALRIIRRKLLGEAQSVYLLRMYTAEVAILLLDSAIMNSTHREHENMRALQETPS